MIKAKEVSLKNIVLFLIFALALSAGYFMARPQAAKIKSVPIFMGEEIVVQRADRAATAVKIVTAAKVARVAEAPAPQPKVITLLPIIPPSINFKVLPAYPSSVLEKGLEGIVLLSVYVVLNGLPEKIETKLSSGIYELDETARSAVAQWKFSPASQGGAPLASWFEVPVRFTIK